MAQNVKNVKDIVVCHVIKNGSILLVKPEEGFGKDKWNAPLGEPQKGENLMKSACRMVFQQTGLYSTKATNHGTVRLYLNGSSEYSYRLHIFSTKVFTGELKPTIKGEAKWFNNSDIPYYDMWADDKYWLGLVLQDKAFEADFFFDEKNERIIKYQVKEKTQVDPSVLKPLIPIAIVAIIIIIGFYSLRNVKFGGTKPTTPLVPTNTVSNTPTANSVSATVKTTTTVTTSIPPQQFVKLGIDNIDMIYYYSGPSQLNNTACYSKAYSFIVPYERAINTTTFRLNTTWYTSNCGVMITNIAVDTPGLSVQTVEPALPIYVPPNSRVYIEYIIKTDTSNLTYSGPLYMIVNED